ncbi:hypothetical protein ASPZODRAFT_17450 [Penicilliopsis zonata CBS 506.65]|uniref:SnoaL-like domain-containing protein n=1 Tax=Penicilliopsis zonata CBS 506.65 TaxID=1073090 RepID=A0A1L9SDL7_9EURO|nr:hypothetical protein ASPZODRAFT_17450 [Penicilliopsis zonata CBS 506.65]OJJ45232.1 hypothetical protein ASPZODRAFT_17450 [Penicilliopsis zonata CBS 506.65]
MAPFDQIETFQAALMSLFAGDPDNTESDLSRLFHPDFTQRDDQTTRDFATFVAHIRWLRENMEPGSTQLTITQLLRDGRQFADRHDSTTKMPDGSVARAETFMFGELAEDGRIKWLVETVRRK